MNIGSEITVAASLQTIGNVNINSEFLKHRDYIDEADKIST